MPEEKTATHSVPVRRDRADYIIRVDCGRWVRRADVVGAWTYQA
jgi:hypothetical protein